MKIWFQNRRAKERRALKKQEDAIVKDKLDPTSAAAISAHAAAAAAAANFVTAAAQPFAADFGSHPPPSAAIDFGSPHPPSVPHPPVPTSVGVPAGAFGATPMKFE